MTRADRIVIVTGISSFVGMHLARRFAREGFRVAGTISKPRAAYNGIRAARLKELDGAITFVELDITDAAAVAAVVDKFKPSLWLHHAGYAAGYASSDYDSAQGFAANVAPLTHIYKSLAGRDCSVIVTGSGAEYSTTDAAAREDDACFPDMPYGLSKLAETLRARQLAAQFGVPTRVARDYLPYGVFDNPEKLLAQVVEGLRRNIPVDLSTCTQARDFLGIGDLCGAYVALHNDMPRTPFDIFNICSGEATPLRDLLLSIAKIMKADPALLRFGVRPARPGDPPVMFGSNDKARRILGWQPAALADAIRRDLLDPVAADSAKR